MNMEDGWLIARFQRLTTELLIERRLGRRSSELTDKLYQTWLEADQRGLKETPEYRNVMKRAPRAASRVRDAGGPGAVGSGRSGIAARLRMTASPSAKLV